MIKIALRRPDNIAYIIDDSGAHWICVGFDGDESAHKCRKKFLLEKQEREALGSLGQRGELSRDPAEAQRQQALVVDMAYCKSQEADRRKRTMPDIPAQAKLSALADRILTATAASPKWDKGSLKRSWYMMNLSHPAVDKLLERYCMKNGICRNFPLSDRERLTFELQLLRPGVLL